MQLSSVDIRNLSGARSVAWSFSLYTLSGQLLGPLDGVQSAEITASTGAVIRTGGQLSWRRPPSGVTPDWHRVLVQPVYTASFPDGSTLEWPLGLFIPAAPKQSQRGGTVAATIELFDQLLILDEDKFGESYSLAAGTVVTAAVRALLDGAGATRAIVTDSTLTLPGAMTWEAGTSRLRIINDLLDAIGYFSLWVDGYGVFRAEQYTPPASRALAWTYEDGARAIYVEGAEEERDTFGIPNRVIAVARSADGGAPMTATAENTNPADPLSYPSRGRWITRRYDDVEAATQGVLDGIAARYLADAASRGGTVELEALPLPLSLVDLNARVAYSNTVTGASVNGVVQAWTFRVDAPLCKLTIREVAA